MDYPAELVILAMGFTGPDKVCGASCLELNSCVLWPWSSKVIDPQNQLSRDQHSNFKARMWSGMVVGSKIWERIHIAYL